MAIKKLQNNFTTLEQSKRMLELGVPRWSADEYRDEKGYRHSLEGILNVELFFQNFPDYSPCWSVGRLIEIYMIAAGLQWIDLCLPDDFTESIVKMFEGTKDLDFSKLED